MLEQSARATDKNIEERLGFQQVTTDGRIQEDVDVPHHDFDEQKGAKDQFLKPGHGDWGT